MEKINLDLNMDNPERAKNSGKIQGMGEKASEVL